MPFDGLSNERQQYLLDKLDAVSDLLSSEQKWCKRILRTPDGGRCLLGALIDANARWLLYRPIVVAAREVTGKSYHRVESFNDDFITSFAEVQAVFARVRVTLIAGTARRSLFQDIIYALQRRAERSGTSRRWSHVAYWLTFPW
jgi:hypothetical protein